MPFEVRGVVALAKGRAGLRRDDRGPRPRARRGGGGGAGLRGVPHRPALPGGRHQRRLPLPAGPRGGRRRRGGGRRRDLGGPRRLRRPQLAGRVRRVPVVPAGAAPVLLRHPQRHPADDPGRRHPADPGARDRGLRREDAGGGRPVHPGRPAGPARGGRPARLRGDGRARGGPVHRRGRPGGLGGRLRMRRRGVRGGGRAPAWPGPPPSSPSTSTPKKLDAGPGVRGHPHRRRRRRGPGGGGPGAHRGQRRRRLHRGGRQPRRDGPGLLRP